MSVEVLLPNGMVVSCHQKHEVPLVQLEVQSYFSNGVQLNAGDTVFDVGANIGLFSLAAYQHCDRDLRIFAFAADRSDLRAAASELRTQHQKTACESLLLRSFP